MNLLITGICGFVGSTLAVALKEAGEEVCGCDNFIRPGSELNRRELARRGVKILHADVRSATDLETLPVADWVIDAAANPSALAGVDSKTTLAADARTQSLRHGQSAARHSGSLTGLTASAYSPAPEARQGGPRDSLVFDQLARAPASAEIHQLGSPGTLGARLSAAIWLWGFAPQTRLMYNERAQKSAQRSSLFVRGAA